MRRVRRNLFVAIALALAVGLASGLSPYASSSPDGLEKVAQDNGFGAAGRLHPAQERAPVADYAFPGIDEPRLATAAAGFAGTLAVFALGWGVALVARRRREQGVVPA